MPERRAFSCNHSQQARAFLASPLALTDTERDRERQNSCICTRGRCVEFRRSLRCYNTATSFLRRQQISFMSQALPADTINVASGFWCKECWFISVEFYSLQTLFRLLEWMGSSFRWKYLYNFGQKGKRVM